MQLALLSDSCFVLRPGLHAPLRSTAGQTTKRSQEVRCYLTALLRPAVMITLSPACCQAVESPG